PAASAMLATVFLSQQNSNPIDSMYIEGHTDSVGTDKRNMTLSQERCESVKKWLLLNSVVDITQVQVHPFGKTRPIATNSTAEGRALNRRVELIVFRRRR
ncbi:MAG: OmpA family protein, partial [Chitinophagaceae bacterium]|nr:OmpA family protein [Chitinophagaceae bacterium]